MPRPGQRVKAIRKLKKNTPGGRESRRYERRKGKIARCAICGKPLSGIPRGTGNKMKGLAKTKKNVNRPYGGNLCSDCMRKLMKNKELERWGYV